MQNCAGSMRANPAQEERTQLTPEARRTLSAQARNAAYIHASKNKSSEQTAAPAAPATPAAVETPKSQAINSFLTGQTFGERSKTSLQV